MRFLITADYGTVFATVEAPPERAVSVVIDEREHGQRRVWMQMCTVPSPAAATTPIPRTVPR